MRFPTPHSQRGFWLSFDLMLTFLVLCSVIAGLLTPVLLDKTYTQLRADYSARLSTALGLSEQAYLGTSLIPAASAKLPGTTTFGFVGYYDAAQLAPFQQSLPPELQNWSIGDAPIHSPNPSHLCVSRRMIDASSQQLYTLWVCER